MQPDEKVIRGRVAALTRISKNNAVTEEDLEPFKGEHEKQADPHYFIGSIFDAQAYARELIFTGELPAKELANLDATRAITDLFIPMPLPKPLSERRRYWASMKEISESTQTRRERSGAELIARYYEKGYERYAAQIAEGDIDFGTLQSAHDAARKLVARYSDSPEVHAAVQAFSALVAAKDSELDTVKTRICQASKILDELC
ncbi:hypothetical protein [Dietzia cinnamea]|uniref:hypothetical protein n=1 Tax=Dietzia cinnamea TaxID=321318 RepID=UPI00223AAA5F|nr:hypothetical protein [Dietzia cinnamea]MCT2077890.1 hypothetical protein [Dietzia cinnamea]MCT2221316.1 hypothetical protein [Dietzia cinnamea]